MVPTSETVQPEGGPAGAMMPGSAGNGGPALRHGRLARRLAIPSALLVIGTLYLLPGVTRPVVPHDEGVIAVGAERVLNGELPYRDFWTFYSPAQYYVVAGLFRIFGVSLSTVRLYGTFVRAIVALLLFLLGVRVAGKGWALAVWSFALMWLGSFSFYGYPIFPALALLLGAVLILTSDAGVGPRSLLLAGVLAGAAGLFRHDYALLFFCPALIVSGLGAVAGSRTARGRRATAATVLARCASFTLGVTAVMLPIFLAFLAGAGAAELRNQLWVFPTSIFPMVRAMPWPRLLPQGDHPLRLVFGDAAVRSGFVRVLPFYLPFVLAGTGIVAAAWRWFRGKPEEPHRPLAAVGAVALFAAMVPQVVVRSDLPHLLPLLLLTGVLIAFDLSEWRRVSHLPPALFAVLGGLVMVALLDWPIRERLAMMRSDGPRAAAVHLQRAGPAQVPESLAAAAQFVRATVPPGGCIFVANATSREILEVDSLLYFLSDRLPGTRHHELHAGVATTARVQRQIVRELDRNRVNVIVLNVARPTERPLEHNRLGRGSALLDEYIATHFRPIARVGGTYLVLRRIS